MKIINSNLEDVPEIFRLYKLATDLQKIKFPKNQWPQFDEKLITSEVEENRQFKLLIGKEIACIWAITFRDTQIWEGSENDPAVYIHRIATNPAFSGNNFVKIIVDWSTNFAVDQNKQFIRMDTCGENLKLIDHYQKAGFTYLGIKKLKDTSALPPHYHNADVCFFEIDLQASHAPCTR